MPASRRRVATSNNYNWVHAFECSVSIPTLQTQPNMYIYVHACMNNLIGPDCTGAHNPCTSALGVGMATVLTMGSLMLCHCLHPYLNILSPRFGDLTRWPWSGFGTGPSFLIGIKAPSRLLHIGVITPLRRFTDCVPLLPLPNSRGHATKRGMRLPNPNSRGHATKRGSRVPNPNRGSIH